MVDRKFGIGVLTCVFNKDFSKILLLKRNEEKRKKNKADWGNVGGRVELGEKLIEACLREAKEEIGIELNSEELKLIEIKENPFLTEIHHALWFIYATILDENTKICLNFNCNEESEDFCWFNLNNLPDKMLDPKEDVLKWAKKAKEILK